MGVWGDVCVGVGVVVVVVVCVQYRFKPRAEYASDQTAPLVSRANTIPLNSSHVVASQESLRGEYACLPCQSCTGV